VLLQNHFAFVNISTMEKNKKMQLKPETYEDILQHARIYGLDIVISQLQRGIVDIERVKKTVSSIANELKIKRTTLISRIKK